MRVSSKKRFENLETRALCSNSHGKQNINKRFVENEHWTVKLNMNNVQFKRGRELSREEIKRILFGWLQSKGILGELQAFLRVKMVEKLSETMLSPTLVTGPLTLQEHAINLIIYEFLKQRQMHYTLSVFASECASIRQYPEVNEAQLNKQILDILNIHSMINISKKKERLTILDSLIEACVSISGKTYASKSSQNLDHHFKKLLINTQIQTEAAKMVPIIPTNSITTQTQSVDTDNGQSVKALNKEILQLRCQLDEALSCLSVCQRQLREAQEKTAQVMAIKLCDYQNPADPVLQPVELPPVQAAYTSNFLLESLTTRAEDVYFERRIQEARQFLNGLDYRLDDLDRKYQRITANPELVRQDDDLPDEGKMNSS